MLYLPLVGTILAYYIPSARTELNMIFSPSNALVVDCATTKSYEIPWLASLRLTSVIGLNSNLSLESPRVWKITTRVVQRVMRWLGDNNLMVIGRLASAFQSKIVNTLLLILRRLHPMFMHRMLVTKTCNVTHNWDIKWFDSVCNHHQ